MNVLLLEDNRSLARHLREALEEEDVTVVHETAGAAGLQKIAAESFDLVVLDLMLPDISGFEVLAEIRRSRKTPVLVISAKNSIDDRVRGLDLGADDYLPKPFAMAEFKARVRARLRSAASERRILTCADLTLDAYSRTVKRGERDIVLTGREFSLLHLLARNKGVVVGRTTIAEQVWGYRFDWQGNIIDVFINQLRSKIDRDFDLKLIRTVRGVGYLLDDAKDV
jgi:two-component system copper resistance phosphate regulon response regulator CusR